MVYATENDLRSRLGEPVFARLTDRADGAVPSGEVAATLLEEAEAVVHALLASRYAVPLQTSGNPALADMLRARTLDLAEHLAWRQSPFVSDMPARVAQLKGDAVRWLHDVGSGQQRLPGVATTVYGGLRVQASPPTLTHDELDHF